MKMSKAIFLILITLSTTPTKGVAGEGEIGLLDVRQKPEVAEALPENFDTTYPILELHTTRKEHNEPRDWEQARTDFHNKFASELPEVMCAKSGDFHVIEELGRGSFGIVYKVQKISDKAVYAVKILGEAGVGLEAVKNEKMLLYALDSKYISKLHYYFQDDNDVFFVMDYINGKQLSRYVSEDQWFSEEDARYILVDVVRALEYLHTVGCIHHDVKLENILITDKGDCTLIDVGFAKVTYGQPVENYGKVPGSPYYVAPELLKREPYTELVDCWSFGVVLYAMVLGEFPFKGDTNGILFEAIKKCKLTFPAAVDFSDEFVHLITNLLTVNLKKRYDIGRIKAHPWFKGGFKGTEGSSQTANVPVSSQ